MDRFVFRNLGVYQKAMSMVVEAVPLSERIPSEQLDLRWQAAPCRALDALERI